MSKFFNKKKIAAAAMALSLCAVGTCVPVSAASVSTSEFGTFTYGLSKSGSTVTAKTQCTKTAPVLITTLQVQVNSTGKKVVEATVTKKNTKTNNIIKAVNTGNVKLAAFSAHEARGRNSVAKYDSEVF